MKKNYRLPLVFLLLFLAVEILLIAYVDRPLSDWARGLESSAPEVINFFKAITDFGKSKWYLWPSAFAMIIGALILRLRIFYPALRLKVAKACHHLFFFFTSIAVSGIVTDIIKPILGRARPVERLRENLYGFHPLTFHAPWNGMPSGHATTAAALAAILCILVPRGRILWLCIGGILATSRVMVNAHYLSDVLAGAAVGVMTVYYVMRLHDHQGMFPVLSGIFPIDKTRLVS